MMLKIQLCNHRNKVNFKLYIKKKVFILNCNNFTITFFFFFLNQIDAALVNIRKKKSYKPQNFEW